MAREATQETNGNFLISKEIGSIRVANKLPLFETHFLPPLPLPPVCSSATIHNGDKIFLCLIFEI